MCSPDDDATECCRTCRILERLPNLEMGGEREGMLLDGHRHRFGYRPHASSLSAQGLRVLSCQKIIILFRFVGLFVRLSRPDLCRASRNERTGSVEILLEALDRIVHAQRKRVQV